MATIRARFIAEANLASLAIRFWTWSHWSHVEFLLEGEWFGARLNGGVKGRPLTYVKPSREKIVEIELTEAQLAALVEWLYRQEGKKYDWLAIIGIVIRRNWRCENRWFCSELYVAAFEYIHARLINADRLNRVTPGQADLSPVPKVVFEMV